MREPLSRRRALRFAAGFGLVAVATGYVGFSGIQYQQRKIRRWLIAFDGNDVSADAQPMLQTAMDDALMRPDQPIRVIGHTGTIGAAAAKRTQSEQRAEAIRTLLIQAGIDENRIKTSALSDQAPLAQLQGESRRAYERRLQRVEVHIGSGS
jgi:outer membrane protein OmpA-like peptidoglycan-associated protein